MQAPDSKCRLLRLPDVLARVPYRKSRLYDLIAAGRFPKPLKLAGGRAAAWLESDVDAHVAGLLAAQGRPAAALVSGEGA